MKSKLVILCGHIGSGKTTLAKEFLKNHQKINFLDVFDYISRYKNNEGFISREQARVAYSEFYDDLNALKGDAIAEIGINHAEYNLEMLSKLKDKFDLRILFCLLDKEECLRRVEERGRADKNRVIHPELIRQKMKVDFPRIHESLAQENDLWYSELDMRKMTKNLGIIKKIFQC